MAPQVNNLKLAALLKTKRGSRGLRDVAIEIGGVSASTLSRIEQGKIPDLDTFMRICHWLKISPEELMSESSSKKAEKNSSQSKLSTSEVVEAHLRADSTLSPDTTEALVKMIQLAYDAVKKNKLKK